MRLVKICSINILVLFFIIIFLEILAGITRLIVKKDFRLPIFFSDPVIISELHPCNKMKTDVLLSHVPNHQEKCYPKGGLVIDEYVIYPSLSKDNPSILILGGSTSSGFYQYFSNGETWPKLFSKLVKDEFNIINGAIGGYSSLQEYYKFSRDGARFKNLKYVISLNGINEMPNYYGLDIIRGNKYPFLTDVQYKMNTQQIWIDQRVYSKWRALFPNLNSLYNYIFSKGYVGEAKNNDEIIDDYVPQFFKAIESAESCEINVKRLNSLVKLNNSKYFVFLQPTLGLIGPQSSLLIDSSDYKIYKNLNKDYLREIRKLYTELKSRCKKLTFCIDISSEVAQGGNIYVDARHHNPKGNLKLANIIKNKLKEFD